MKRFEKAQVGDKVNCRRKGEGIINYILLTEVNCLAVNVNFINTNCWYTLDGKQDPTDVEAILFYRDDKSNYLTERPKAKVKKVIKRWTNVYAKDDKSLYYCYSTKEEAIVNYLQIGHYITTIELTGEYEVEE